MWCKWGYAGMGPGWHLMGWLWLVLFAAALFLLFRICDGRGRAGGHSGDKDTK